MGGARVTGNGRPTAPLAIEVLTGIAPFELLDVADDFVGRIRRPFGICRFGESLSYCRGL